MLPQSSNDTLEWAKRILETHVHREAAAKAFYETTDKELALKAAYKSMGLDPRDAPVFGWDLAERPRQSITNQTIYPGEAPKRGLSLMIPWSLLTLGLMGVALFVGSEYFPKTPPRHITCEELDANPALREKIKKELEPFLQKKNPTPAIPQ